MPITPMNILIVEDDASHAAAIRRALNSSALVSEVSVVSTLQGYRNFIEQRTPDVVIMDLNLPDGRAVEVLTSPANNSPFPTLLMTSYGNEQVAVEAIKAGALDYIVKSPEAFMSLAGTIERAKREWNLLQEKKLMENQLRESQAQVVQQEKMASIGLLAAGVAHEINNPIGYITSNLNSLAKYTDKLVHFIEAQQDALDRLTDQQAAAAVADLRKQLKLDYLISDLRELIAETQDGSRRVSKIVQDLQNFSRADGNETIQCNLNETIKSTINIVRNEIKYVAELELRLAEMPPVFCRPQQIGQVILNLLLNAAHSITDNGRISLETACDGTNVEISVTDNGCGIRQEHLDKIFEPFFTTKESGKGTGLGLAISRDIVKRHGGELLVRSGQGAGTTFTVRLPLCPENTTMPIGES